MEGMENLICCSCHTQGSMEECWTGPGSFVARCRQCGGKFNPDDLVRWRDNELPMLQVSSGYSIVISKYDPTPISART